MQNKFENDNISELMISPAGVRACGSIHTAFILSILTRRYFECKQAGALSPDGAFACPKQILENRIGLKIQTVNKHLRTLKDRGAIIVHVGKPGEPRLFKIDDRVIQSLSGSINKGSGENGREGDSR